MRVIKVVFSLLPLAFFSVTNFSQSALPPRVDPPRGAIVPNTPARQERDLERRMGDLRTLEARSRIQSMADRKVEPPPRLSGEEQERVKRMRKVAPEYVKKYEALFRARNSGLFKLFPNRECVSTRVVNVDEKCKDFVPLSSGFSFRNRGYADELYHDIFYEAANLSSYGFFSQGIFVPLGDVPIESIGADHVSVTSLSSLPAEVSTKEAIENAKRFRQGFTEGGLRYSDAVPLEFGKTYLLRNISYGIANSFPAISSSSTMTELKFLSLSVDSRTDAIVAFQVLAIDQDGGATLVWKRISSEAAPKLKFPKGTAPRDLRENTRGN